MLTVVIVLAVLAKVALVVVLLWLRSLPKRRVWPVPEGLGAVPSMRPARRQSAA